jgi:hypothetical protein
MKIRKPFYIVSADMFATAHLLDTCASQDALACSVVYAAASGFLQQYVNIRYIRRYIAVSKMLLEQMLPSLMISLAAWSFPAALEPSLSASKNCWLLA